MSSSPSIPCLPFSCVKEMNIHFTVRIVWPTHAVSLRVCSWTENQEKFHKAVINHYTITFASLDSKTLLRRKITWIRNIRAGMQERNTALVIMRRVLIFWLKRKEKNWKLAWFWSWRVSTATTIVLRSGSAFHQSSESDAEIF